MSFITWYLLIRWCLIEKFNRIGNVSLIVVDGISIQDYLENVDYLPGLNQFSIKVDVISTHSYDGDVVTDISAVSLSDSDRASLIRSKLHLSIEKSRNDGRQFLNAKFLRRLKSKIQNCIELDWNLERAICSQPNVTK